MVIFLCLLYLPLNEYSSNWPFSIRRRNATMKIKIFIAFLLGQTWKKGKKTCSGFTDFEFQIINIVSAEKTIGKFVKFCKFWKCGNPANVEYAITTYNMIQIVGFFSSNCNLCWITTTLLCFPHTTKSQNLFYGFCTVYTLFTVRGHSITTWM